MILLSLGISLLKLFENTVAKVGFLRQEKRYG